MTTKYVVVDKHTGLVTTSGPSNGYPLRMPDVSNAAVKVWLATLDQVRRWNPPTVDLIGDTRQYTDETRYVWQIVEDGA